MADVFSLDEQRRIVELNQMRSGFLDSVPRAWRANRETIERWRKIKTEASKDDLGQRLLAGWLAGGAGETPLAIEQVDALIDGLEQIAVATEQIQAVRPMFRDMPKFPQPEPEPPADVPIVDLPPE